MLSVCFEIDKQTVTLLHRCTDELKHLPHFFLKDYSSFGVLAHVLPVEHYEELGNICVNHTDSVSVNFERPELAFEESIRRHIDLIGKLLTNPEFNEKELLREFRTNWYANTKSLLEKPPKTLYFPSKSGRYTTLDIYKPLSPDSVVSISASFVAQPNVDADNDVARFFQIDRRKRHQDAIGCIIPLQLISPVIPRDAIGLKTWILNALKQLPLTLSNKLDKELYPIRAKEFWLAFNVNTPSGTAWVGAKLTLDKKRVFPDTLEKFERWQIEPIFVDVFNKELMLPRSGANPTLDKKKILIFGCGSVGSEIAHKLGSAGVGQVDIVDPDTFSTSNLYRHTLESYYTGWSKAHAVALQLKAKFPWIKSTGYITNLLDSRTNNITSAYDLIVIAIGSPTHERLFHDYLVKSAGNTPAIYSWLEGFGIGGHAILDIPRKKGCLRCAYVESNTGTRGLASNLNFLIPNQNIVKNYAGCGEMFIPYGAISSTQTALIAADLAISYLEKKLTESTKVSWKGDSKESELQGLKLTSRYYTFNSSLKKQLLRHPLCDICHPEEPIKFLSPSGKRLYLAAAVYQKMLGYKQIEPSSVESAGLLIGCYLQNGDVLVDEITTPKASDTRTRTTFTLDAEAHQADIDTAYDESDRLLGYIGTWHTHPQDVPVPSGIDKMDWRSHERDNPDRPLFFIVVGLQKTSAYTLHKGSIVELSLQIESVLNEEPGSKHD